MIEIRPSTSQDFPHILALLRQLWPGREREVEAVGTVFLEALSSDSCLHLSACYETRVVGLTMPHGGKQPAGTASGRTKCRRRFGGAGLALCCGLRRTAEGGRSVQSQLGRKTCVRANGHLH